MIIQKIIINFTTNPSYSKSHASATETKLYHAAPEDEKELKMQR